jgi:hypothetical protein
LRVILQRRNLPPAMSARGHFRRFRLGSSVG